MTTHKIFNLFFHGGYYTRSSVKINLRFSWLKEPPSERQCAEKGAHGRKNEENVKKEGKKFRKCDFYSIFAARKCDYKVWNCLKER